MRMLQLNVAAAAVAAALAGCASTPSEPPTALEQARSAFQAAKSNPHVPRFAPNELNQAGQRLDQVERLWTRGEDAEMVAHEAYIAKQQARIASEIAAARAAHIEIEQADTERKNVIAQSRAQQAQSAAQTSEAERLAAERRAEQVRQQAALEQQRSEQQIKQLESQLKDLKAEQTNRGWVLTLGSDVLFDVGKSVLLPGAYRSIEQVGQFLQANPDRSITIAGYTDSTGSEQLNLDLSRRRAEAVKQALVARNIDPSRIRVQAYGEANPVATNDTSAGRQLNRRVEVVIENMPGDPQRAAMR
jgi:outer membrane protein OmpA-like peptidoglycan-associated protein